SPAPTYRSNVLRKQLEPEVLRPRARRSSRHQRRAMIGVTRTFVRCTLVGDSCVSVSASSVPSIVISHSSVVLHAASSAAYWPAANASFGIQPDFAPSFTGNTATLHAASDL